MKKCATTRRGSVKCLLEFCLRYSLAFYENSREILFDGDEMNIWVPQSEQSKAECATILSTASNFLSSQDSKPLIGLKQDGMTGGYLLTYGYQPIDKAIFMEILTTEYFELFDIFSKIDHIKNVHKKEGLFDKKLNQLKVRINEAKEKLEKQLEYNKNLQKTIKEKHSSATIKSEKLLHKKDFDSCKQRINTLKEQIDELLLLDNEEMLIEKAEDELLYTGHSLFSFLLQDDLEYTCNNEISPDGTKVYITRGVLLTGTLNKVALGNSSGSLIHHIAKDYGNEAAINFVSFYEMMINNWLIHRGFSIGMADCIPKNTNMIEKEINNYMMEATIIMNNEKDREILETKVNAKLNKAATIGQTIASKALEPTNNLVSMIRSGAKGNIFNISQVTGLVGQQNVGGNRMQKLFGGRTLPHYPKQGYLKDIPDILSKNIDLTQQEARMLFESRGFVSNSFFKGLNPKEFFFHAAGGREGLIDTACKSVTGDTLIMIIEDNVSKMVKIGDWIDNLILHANKKDLEYINERNMELLHIPLNKSFVPSINKDGNVCWDEMVAVTRHDPGNIIYEITTNSGRSVKVVESKSLLIYDIDKKQFLDKLTSEVKIGDFVPLNMNLPEPPIINSYVDMSKYLSKNKYVYGTDFYLAKENMNVAMNSELTKSNITRTKIPEGWWKNSNNKLFTLPYPSKARFQRTLVRSNIDNIKKGFIYPYSGAREDILIPDKFELNEENGIFIGLYLADGNSDLESGYIQITKNNEAVQQFVSKWFTKYGIKHQIKKYVRENGTFCEIRGFSRVLISFIDNFVGKSSYNKYVPNEAYTAPIEFVKGLLNGYFSGDGTVGKTFISCSSASSLLIDGINLLCNRLGIFCKLNIRKSITNINMYTLDIRSKWANIFKEQLNLIEDNKYKKLQEISPSKEHINFSSQNDVILDKIIKIEKLDVSKYPKVYDITVPKTLNFMAGNGLHLKDTADTGYIQRKIIKMIEDCYFTHQGIIYQGTSGNIVEFMYGGDNLDASRLIKTSEGFCFIDISHTVDKINKDYEWSVQVN
jgi:intein/homing endonuclease